MRARKCKLPALDEISAYLRYEPDTGRIIRTATRGSYKAGTTIGYIHTRTGYIHFWVGKQSHLAHRIAWLLMTGSWPAQMIDHINGNRSDNRWCNLRAATNQQNTWNSKGRNSKSGIKGVFQEYHRFRAMIRLNGRSVHLGAFATKEEASAAYMKAAREAFGEFARAS